LPEAAGQPTRHREASLYRPLAGAGARTGDQGAADAASLLESLREAALSAYESSEPPVWRRSGFWTTSFAGLEMEALEVRHHEPGAQPEIVTRTLP
jgi:hypothetical protein